MGATSTPTLPTRGTVAPLSAEVCGSVTVATTTTVLLSDVALVSEFTAPAPRVVAPATVPTFTALVVELTVGAEEVDEEVLVAAVLVLVCEVLEVDEAPVAEEVVLCDDEVVPLLEEDVVVPPVAEEAVELVVVFTAVGVRKRRAEGRETHRSCRAQR